MKMTLKISLVLMLAAVLPIRGNAQNASSTTPTAAISEPRTNTAIIPVDRDGRAKPRTDEVLKRAKENPGEYDVVFLGDSITQGWEGAGKEVWEKQFSGRKCINFGVGGDRTQHVLWRFENGQLDGIKPKAVVLLIGTNNSNKEDNTEAEILEGVTTIVAELKKRAPQTKVLLMAIFPRGQTFSTQRGKILQVNQALAKQANGKNVFFIDIGPKLIEKDGSISKDIMPDYLHLSPKGYEIWAKAVEGNLKKLGI
jgi:beta-glucosidase